MKVFFFLLHFYKKSYRRTLNKTNRTEKNRKANMMFIPFGQNNSINLSFVNNEIDQNIMKKRKIRNKFTPEEDKKLVDLIKQHGDRSWNLVSKLMGTRNQRQCRERWKHYLSCDMKNSLKPWTKEEDEILINKYNELGAKWTKIARELPGRSDLQVKVRYMKHLRHKKNKYIHGESETSDEDFYPDDDDDEYKKNSVDKDNEKRQKNNQNSVGAESINSEISFSGNSNKNTVSDDLGFSLDLDIASSNFLEELCKCDESCFLDHWAIMTF